MKKVLLGIISAGALLIATTTFAASNTVGNQAIPLYNGGLNFALAAYNSHLNANVNVIAEDECPDEDPDEWCDPWW